MKSRPFLVAVTALAVGIALPGSAQAQQNYSFSFVGAGVSGNVTLTYGPASDMKYPNGFEMTGVSGSFTDTNNGLNIHNATITSLVPVSPTPPADPLNTVAPHDFSMFAVATGLPVQAGGVLTYTNLFWPDGAPVTCNAFDGAGGFLDTYGMMFGIGNGQYVDIFSNGIQGNAADYGLAVATSANALDYVSGGVTTTTTPEPGTVWLLGSGLVGMVGWRRRTKRA